MKFELKPYHSSPKYIKFLEECHSICNSIYIHRNITLNELKIIEELKKIDKLLADKEKS